MRPPDESDAVRHAFYVLFARLLAAPLDATFYERCRMQGLGGLAHVQGVDLTSDLLDEEDAEGSALELSTEFDELFHNVSLRASDYEGGTEDPVASISGFLKEHAMEIDASAELPRDHLSVALGIMGALTASTTEERAERQLRARSFLHRHLLPWAPQALAEVASRAHRRFYRGLAAMVAAFLDSERRLFEAA